MDNATKVVANTIILYIKMIFSIVFGLLTTRWVLQALGVEDYGIYNLVAGIVSMLSFLNTALAGSTQRYMSFYLGRLNEKNRVTTVFGYSVILHFVIGVVVAACVELVGVQLINHVLNIPDVKIGTAKIVLHILAVSCFFSIQAVPYHAVMITHENMLAFSVFSIAEYVLRLGIAALLFVVKEHKLELYALLTALSMVVLLIIKGEYCKRQYVEVQYKTNEKDTQLLKSMTSFAGWNLIGSVCNLARGQGLAMVMNVFYGVVVNAAYGVANQLNGLLSYFSAAMMQSLRPQIVKSEGAGDRARMLRLTLIACKYMFYLSAVFAIPLILEMPYVLSIWLKDVPDYTISFCRLIMIFTVLSSLSTGLYTAMEAVGQIKYIQLIVGILHVTVLPISYLMLRLAYPPYSALVVMCIEEGGCCVLRVLIARKVIGLPVMQYVNSVLLRVLPVFAISFCVGGIILNLMNSGALRAVVVAGGSLLSFVLLVYMIGMTKDERYRLHEICIAGLKKLTV